MGPKPDLEIIGLISKEMKSNIGIWKSAKVLNEIRTEVRTYQFPLIVVESGGAAATSPVEGPASSTRPDLVWSARNNLFHSGTLGRYCSTLKAVVEAPGTLYGEPVNEPVEALESTTTQQ